MKKLLNKEFLFGLLLFSIISLIPLLWFPNNEILLGYDNVYPLNHGDFLADRIFSWSSAQGFYADQSGVQGSLIIHFIDSIPQFIGFSDQSSQKIVYCFWFFMLLLSPFILAVRLEKFNFIQEKYVKYIFPILYAVNFYVLQAWWVAERTKFSLLVATPFILAIIFPMLKSALNLKKIFKDSVLCAIILSIFNGGSWAGLPLYGGLLVILVLFYIFASVFFYFSKERKNILYLNLFFIFFGVWFVLLNAYTLLPFLATTLKEYNNHLVDSGGISGLIDWTRYLTKDASFINLLRLQGIPDWYDNIYHSYSFYYLTNPVLIFISFLFPLLIFYSFIFVKKENRLIMVFFLMLLIVSLFFTAGSHSPLGFIFEFFMEKIPGFASFRSAIYKFGYAYWLSSGFLIAISLGRLMNYLTNFFKKTYLFNLTQLSLIPIIIGILLYHFPYLTGNIFRNDPYLKARMEIPDYVYKFSDWWKKNGSNENILLLPKLSKENFFEEYNWGYISLFPILGNFGNEGVIENTSTLALNERFFLDNIYESIKNRDFKRTDDLTSLLGIRYFLIRKDFYYQNKSKEIEDPLEIGKDLVENPKIEKIRSFGEWDLYKYLEEKPFFFVKNDVAFFPEENKIDYDSMIFNKNKLLLNKDAFLKNPTSFSQTFLIPFCLSCEAVEQDFTVKIPKQKILLDSPFYELTNLKNKVFSRNETEEQKVVHYISDSIKFSGQFSELAKKETTGEEFITLAKNRYIESLDKISEKLPSFLNISKNPYYLFSLLENYLEGEKEFFEELLLTKISKNNTLVNAEKILYAINKLEKKIENYNDIKNLNTEKKYKFETLSTKEYQVKINKEDLGIFAQEITDIKLSIDGKQLIAKTSIDDNYFTSNMIFLKQGNHDLTIYFPEQRKILSEPKQEEIAGKICFSSFLDGFSSKYIYVLNFNSKNNFDPNLFYFIDNGKSFSPFYAEMIPMTGERIKKHRLIISSEKFVLNVKENKIRISFCASSINNDWYKEAINDLSISPVLDLNPKILLAYEKKFNMSTKTPEINYKKLNKIHYKVFVKNAQGPFYLYFGQRYSSGWQASIGEHFMANKFANAWFINKNGDFTVDIIYKPQEFFDKGLLISIISLILLISGLFFLQKKGKYES